MTGQVPRKIEFNVLGEDVRDFNSLPEKPVGSHQPGASYTTSGCDGRLPNVWNILYLNLITNVANFDTAMCDDVEVA